MPTSPLPPARCCASTLLAPLPARRRFPPLAEPARRLRASHPRDLTALLGLCETRTPRPSPISCRPSVPTSPLPPAPSQRVGTTCPLASSAPAHAERRASASFVRLYYPVTSPRCSASAMLTHRAAARGRVGLPCRNCRCRPRRLRSSVTLASSRARCRLTPRAGRAHLSRLLATTVTSPRALCDTHHCATAQEPVDLPRRRCCCRSRRRGASTLLALLRARRRPLPRAE